MAFHKASKGKRGKAPAAAFEYGLEDNLIDLQTELENRTYRPGTYHSFYIHDPKRRLISAASFETAWPIMPFVTFSGLGRAMAITFNNERR